MGANLRDWLLLLSMWWATAKLMSPLRSHRVVDWLLVLYFCGFVWSIHGKVANQFLAWSDIFYNTGTCLMRWSPNGIRLIPVTSKG
jgi:hypothetical protein